VHKLIVARERGQRFALKAQKDLEQSFDLQAVLEKLDPESLEDAFEAAKKKGPGWRTRLDASQKALRSLLGGGP
jgi:hypothetical protein